MEDYENFCPNSPTANWDRGLDFYLLDWEEHSVDGSQTPDRVHERVKKLRDERSIFREFAILEHGPLGFGEPVLNCFESRRYAQSEQRKLARLICKRRYAAGLDALSGGEVSKQPQTNCVSKSETLVENFIKSIMSSNESQQMVLKLSDVIRSLENQVETLVAIKLWF